MPYKGRSDQDMDIFGDTFVRHKNTNSKSGDSLSDHKLKWKYYDIMSYFDITLPKWGCVPNLFNNILNIYANIHTYKKQLHLNWSDQFRNSCIKL